MSSLNSKLWIIFDFHDENGPKYGSVRPFLVNFYSRQSTLCGYSKLVSGDDWHHANLIRSFRSSNFEKTLKIWSKYWWFHIFERFLNSGRLDSTDFCCISSDISWQAYRVPTRHTLMKLWNGHFWPNRPFLTKQAIFVAILAKKNPFFNKLHLVGTLNLCQEMTDTS